MVTQIVVHLITIIFLIFTLQSILYSSTVQEKPRIFKENF